MIDELRFKSEYMRAQLRRVDPLLQDIVNSLASYVWNKYGVPLVITEVYRPARHPSDLHALWRAVDTRVSDFTTEIALELREWVNSRVVYDEARSDKKSAVFGDNDPDGKHDDHMHIQVHHRSFVKKF